MKRKRQKPGLTLVEILTVIAIIALLTGILIPAVTAVRNAAKEVKQKGQFATIELAIQAFKNDQGDYPPSSFGAYLPGGLPMTTGVYFGSQKLSEALLGWDLLGFHPDSAWRNDGFDATPPGGPNTYDPLVPPVTGTRARGMATFDERKKPYLETGSQYAFELDKLYPKGISAVGYAGLNGIDRYLLCDIYGVTKVTLRDGSTVKAGAPILYYRADSSARFNDPTLFPRMMAHDNQGNIYNCLDNYELIKIKEAEDNITTPFDENAFYRYIEDKKIVAKPTPYNPSSYILISAGPDGTYGTQDDIRNFGN